ncbi:MAG: prephenate dehydrogenase/arogenate dehydrogenase family protein [Solirubrobacterales bacterium]|nr:prephenate dehydrogenase/arogenate dehydrogenase family protein [Solirubrobacterales bacterium]
MRDSALQGERCVVVGGAGAVGGLVMDLLLGAGTDVVVVDVAAPPAEAAQLCAYMRGDVCAMDARLVAEMRRADIVVLAVPEGVALAAVPALARQLRPGALLVDTLSVKTGIVATLGAHAAHLEAVSLNPMFAPALGFDGRAVAAVVVRDGPRSRALLDAVGRRGGRVAEVGADEHDRVVAVTQALTHAAVLAFGLALDELDVDVEDLGALATPPHVTLLGLLARITSGGPETYRDVQARNPHAHRARTALAAGIATLADAADHGTGADFAAILDRAHESLGPHCDAYARVCEELFVVARPPAPLLAHHESSLEPFRKVD